MKSALIMLAVLGLIFAGCSKDSSTTPPGNTTTPTDTGYYMKFQANGVQKDFTLTSSIFYATHCSLNGGTNDSTGNNFTINIYPNDSVRANVDYTGMNTATNIPFSYLSYAVNNPGSYNYFSWQPLENYHVTCHAMITELTSTYVKGTFSGQVRKADSSENLTISNGSFYVKR